jgi:CRISPR-associated protein Csm3
MFAKILIKAEIEVKTGMHIGTGGEFAAIGAVDSPVVRDPLSGDPVIPCSTFKG